VDGSPANLGRILDLEVPMVRVDYELGQRSRRRLEGILEDRGLIQ
jgi:hypothetical protein